MTKGTKIFRIIITILLVLTMLWTAFISIGLFVLGTHMIHRSEYGIFVAGESVTRQNKDDILGDGTVSYNSSLNLLTFNNAVIEHNEVILASNDDLRVELIGENKFLCKDNGYIPAIFIGQYYSAKDLTIEGEGSLIVEFENVTENALGIYADQLIVDAGITINTPDCVSTVHGILCNDSLIVKGGGVLTVNNGAAYESSALGVRGNVMLEPGAAVEIASRPGSVESCKGVSVDGDLILAKNTKMSVSVNDENAKLGECLTVSGILDIGFDVELTASANTAYSIECYGAVKVSEGAKVTANTAGENVDIFCYGSLVNYGADVNGEIDALGGAFDKVR